MKSMYLQAWLFSWLLPLSLAPAARQCKEVKPADFMTEEEQFAAALRMSTAGFSREISDAPLNGFCVVLRPYAKDSASSWGWRGNEASLHADRLNSDEMLIAAAKRDDFYGVQRAIQAGADVNACDQDGRTTLNHAMENSNKWIIRILQAAGATRLHISPARWRPTVPRLPAETCGGSGRDSSAACLSSACATARPAWQIDDLNEEGLMAMGIAQSIGEKFVPRPDHLLSRSMSDEGDDRPLTRRRMPAFGCDKDDEKNDETGVDDEQWSDTDSDESLAENLQPYDFTGLSPNQALLYVGEQGIAGHLSTLLKDREAVLTIQNEAQETALLLACKNGCTSVAKELIALYQLLDKTHPVAKRSPLWWRFLDIPDITSKTPLMHAVLSANGEIAAALVTAGANVNAWDNDGWTALGIAKARKAYGGIVCDETIALLESKGAKDGCSDGVWC